VCLVASLGVILVVPTAHATDPAPPNSGDLRLDLGTDLTSAYYFRGLRQEDSGLIVQPWIELGVELAAFENGSLGATLGNWNSVHDRTGTAGTSDGFTRHWYESDLYAGLNLDHGAWSLGLTYIVYTSPSDAFSSIDEIAFCAAFDDASLWNDEFALNPHATIAIETNDRGGSEDAYLELGVAPALTWDLSEDIELDVAFPVTVGLSLDDYYVDANGDDDLFGYLDVGAEASAALPVSAQYGRWTISAGVHALWLGDAAEQVNDDDGFEVIASIGISIEY
jgi:hypothetical protein